MVILFILLLDHQIVASIIEYKKITVSKSFQNMEDFLNSLFWSQYKNTPRFIFTEQENTYTLLNLEALSGIEKILLLIRYKFLTPNTQIFVMSWNQFILFDPSLPQALKKGPLLKTRSALLYLLRSLRNHTRNNACLYYYSVSTLGLWQLAINQKSLLFHQCVPLATKMNLKELLQEARQSMYQMGISETIHDVDISTLLKKKSDFIENYFISLNDFFLVYHSQSAPSAVQKLIAACFLLIFCINYNITSINMWETQIKVSRNHLKNVERSINSPAYAEIKKQFKDGKLF